MKIRNGFVSNSSSSSFIVMLPDNFVETVDFSKIEDIDDEFPLDDFKSLLKKFVDRGGMWNEEIYDFERDLDLDDDYGFYDILDDLMRPYVLTSIDTGPDAGQYIIVTQAEIYKKIDEINER